MIDDQTVQAVGGVKPAVGTIHAPLSDAELSHIESACGCKLPGDYRDFLAHYGAVAFRRRVLVNPIITLPNKVSWSGKDYLDVLYGKEISGRNDFDIVARYQVCRNRIPHGLLPIGNNGAGNQFCIGVQGEELGQIFYWDHNDEFDEEDYLEDLGIDLEEIEDDERPPIPREAWFKNVYPIATSFEDLFSRLEVDSDD